jgi:hypothetical protein
MRLTHLSERPSAFTAACAPAHAPGVGRVAVTGLPDLRWRPAQQDVAYPTRQSVQSNDAQVLFQGTNGLMAKAIRMAKTSLVKGVEAKGVPPRGRPV